MRPAIDVTADVIDRLNRHVPSGNGMTEPDRRPNIAGLGTAGAAQWLSDLKPQPLRVSSIRSRAASPILDDLSLFAPAPSVPESEAFVLQFEDARGRPRLFGVWHPKDIRRTLNRTSGQLPFLVMLNPLIKQNIERRFGGTFDTDPKKRGRQTETGYYIGYPSLAIDPSAPLNDTARAQEKFFHPLGWDYPFFQIWQKFNYKGDPVLQPNSHGFPYQIAAAHKCVILVVPIVSAEDDLGEFAEPPRLFHTLLMVQDHILRTLGLVLESSTPLLGPVAIGAFSAGNRTLKRMLEGLGAWNEISEIYMFDPPNDVGDALIDAVIKWSRTIFNPKIRLYANTVFGNASKIVPAVPSPKPQLHKSMDGARSVAMFTPKAWARLLGEHILASPTFRRDNARSPTKPRGLNLSLTDPVDVGEDFLRKNSGSSYHQYLPALLLTDALSRSAFPSL